MNHTGLCPLELFPGKDFGDYIQPPEGRCQGQTSSPPTSSFYVRIDFFKKGIEPMKLLCTVVFLQFIKRIQLSLQIILTIEKDRRKKKLSYNFLPPRDNFC